MENSKLKKPIYKRTWFVVLVLLIVGGSLAGIGGNKAKMQNEQAALNQNTENEKKDEDKKAEVTSVQKGESPKAEEPVKEEVPKEYKNALKKAETYSESLNMSKEAIFNQLISDYGEQFSREAAQYAIDNIKADWKENALKKAQTYQESMAMSKKAIYDQLIAEYGEKFTKEEAQYAIDNLK